ncbi:hypothetical protein Lfu02_35440 [Longispora fulva]|uniref:Uncharacterized protein n=1 Tax=Longispora fulva TaxID=619741 RepID=A0A8J7H4X7_9ACTN|nr:hypothetical protein [Longispora fulva]MBG6141673.1 hypothetical protein [Longispora fulva]GIG59172.1 hypothetical protein Lfu02_35440 [Longispora fulva]
MRARSLLVALLVAVCGAVLGPVAPAQAATADQWGFALVDNPTVPLFTTLNTTRQWGTWKTAFPADWASGGKLATGRFRVKFPHIGTPKGFVHVTPVSRTGNYCEILFWTPSGVDEILDVQCHKPGGVADDTAFTVMWSVSSGVAAPPGSHAYVRYGTSGIVDSYNSTGLGVSGGPLGTGQYSFKLYGVGLATVLSGNLQATAIQPNGAPRRCNIYQWSMAGTDIVAYVFCYNQAGAATNTEFTLSYHRERTVLGSFAPPKYFGYVWTAGNVGQTNFNYPTGLNTNVVGTAPPLGRFIVKYPNLGQKETTAQVTANSSTSRYCNLTSPWTYSGPDAVVDVICFDNAGVYTPEVFFSTFTSRI